MDSILTSIKKLIGSPEEYEHFDTDIIIHINTAFNTLTQLGVGPEEGFRISDATAIWDDFIDTSDTILYEAVKTYIYLRVKLIFDPPNSGATIGIFKETIKELEWRLNVTADEG